MFMCRLGNTKKCIRNYCHIRNKHSYHGKIKHYEWYANEFICVLLINENLTDNLIKYKRNDIFNNVRQFQNC